MEKKHTGDIKAFAILIAFLIAAMVSVPIILSTMKNETESTKDNKTESTKDYVKETPASPSMRVVMSDVHWRWGIPIILVINSLQLFGIGESLKRLANKD